MWYYCREKEEVVEKSVVKADEEAVEEEEEAVTIFVGRQKEMAEVEWNQEKEKENEVAVKFKKGGGGEFWEEYGMEQELGRKTSKKNFVSDRLNN